MLRHNAFISIAFAAALALAAPDPTSASAQTLEWIRQLGTPTLDNAYGVSADELGNVFLSGSTRGSLGGPFAGGWDAFFAKYDSNGTRLWTRQLGTSSGESAWGISADGQGNVYVQGDTAGNLFGQNAGGFDVWLAKYAAGGTMLWGRQLGTAGHEEYGAVAANPLGGAYISGRTTGALWGPNGDPGNNRGDQFLARYSDAGDLLWTRQLTSLGDDNYSQLAADSMGNVYIAGATLDSLFGPNAGSYDAYLAKYDADGILLWAKQFGTSAEDGSTGGVTVDNLGNVYMLGRTFGSLGGPNAGDGDVFLSKFNADGTQLWTRQFGSPSFDSGSYFYGGTAADGNGNVYITGRTEGDLGWGNSGDVFVAKYDTNGNRIWGQQLGGASPSEGRARISTDRHGNVYFSGYTSGSLGGPYPNPGNGDAFLGKFRDNSVPEPSALVLAALALAPLATRSRSRRASLPINPRPLVAA